MCTFSILDSGMDIMTYRLKDMTNSFRQTIGRAVARYVFLVRHTTFSTWVKTPKGLKMVEKWGLKEQKVSLSIF